jgi:hypothetical protein
MPQVIQFQSESKPDLGRAAQPIIAAGQQAWARLNQYHTWRDWALVGKALAVGRAEALAIARTKKPEGRRYNTAFHDWLGWNGFAGISKSTRARLLECMANLEKIEAWRATLSPNELLRLNHPTTVLGAWRRATAEPRAKGTNAPVPVSITALARMFERLNPQDRASFVNKILGDHPDLVPEALRHQLLRQHQRPGDVAYARIAKRAREIRAFCHHPEQHADAIRKAAAEILRAVEPKVTKPVAASPTPVGDLSAWPRAMGLSAAKTTADAWAGLDIPPRLRREPPSTNESA